METKIQRRFFDLARNCARRQAVSAGLQPADVEDCAQGFVVRCYQMKYDPPLWMWSSDDCGRFLHRAVRNFVLNFIAECGRRRHESLDSSIVSQARMVFLFGRAKTEYLPEAYADKNDFWYKIAKGLQAITPAQRDILVRYHLDDQTVAELAASIGTSMHAVQERTSLARKRLQQALCVQGETRTELTQYAVHTDLHRSIAVRRFFQWDDSSFSDRDLCFQC